MFTKFFTVMSLGGAVVRTKGAEYNLIIQIPLNLALEYSLFFKNDADIKNTRLKNKPEI